MKKGKRTPPPLAYRAEEALRKAVAEAISPNIDATEFRLPSGAMGKWFVFLRIRSRFGNLRLSIRSLVRSENRSIPFPKKKVSSVRCGLARPRSFVGGKSTQVPVRYGSHFHLPFSEELSNQGV
jgi:hypothetical protein